MLKRAWLANLLRFKSDTIVDRISKPLFTPEVTFCRLNTDMPEQELNLLELSSRLMREPCTGPPKIMGSNLA